MNRFRTDLAMECTAQEAGEGVRIDRQQLENMETTWVRITSQSAAERFGKPQGVYWTLTHPQLPELSPLDRMPVAKEAAQVLRLMLPPKGGVLVLGLGNRRMTADALGDRVVSGILVTRHLNEPQLRSVCAVAPGVMGVTGIETAEIAIGLTQRIKPAAVIVVDALAAMHTDHICTTIQITDTGIHPGSGVGNHRRALTKETLQVPVIAIGVPMVVYASTILRDGLEKLLQAHGNGEDAASAADELTGGSTDDLVVTPRNVDEVVQGVADMLALAINTALQPECSMEELTYYLH